MSVYGNLIVVNENGIMALDESRDPERVKLVDKINGSIQKTLTKLGFKASVKRHKFLKGVSKFTNNKKDSFTVEIVLEQLIQGALSSIINALPIPYVIKVIIISIINSVSKTETLEAIKIITAAEDEIMKNFEKDIPGVKLKIESIEKNGNYTNDILMTISIED